MRKGQWSGILLLVLAVASPDSLCAQPKVGEPRPMKEIYQDFRHAPLQEAFRLGGAPDANDVTRAEPDGLRITLPAVRRQHSPVEVRARFSLFGDFDVTGTYELLTAAEPAQGYGVGVALIIADSDKRDKFLKVSRLYRPEAGSVYYCEFWTRFPPKDFQSRAQPTKVRAGQLRLARDGARLRCLVADELGKDFSVLYELPNFGAEALAHLCFEVADGNSPNNPVDARLIDLRVRTETFPADRGAGPVPLPPQPPNIPVDDAGAPRASRASWLAAALCFLCTLLLAGVVTMFLVMRQRNAARNGDDEGQSAG